MFVMHVSKSEKMVTMVLSGDILNASIIENLGIGIVVIDRQYHIQTWNHFMAKHSGIHAQSLIGDNLFERFPELPHHWIGQKIDLVFKTRRPAFIAWQSRPWLFQFKIGQGSNHEIDYMRQDVFIQPIQYDDSCDHVAIVVMDTTDAAYYQKKLLDTLEALEQSSITDALTSMYNRSHIQQRFPMAFSSARDHGLDLAVIMFDLDHFKHINDSYGHQAGDLVLQEISRRCKPLIRGHDLLARYGGEEFLLIAPDTDLHGGCLVAERLRQAMSVEPVMYKEQAIVVTASFGVTQICPAVPNAETLLECADEALYAAKNHGRNSVFCKRFNQIPMCSTQLEAGLMAS